ncbi:Uncharacterised protein family (UPF0236) [Alicyclobacillus vulcanalis]|uniref:Uncharacterized protein family (UPF0236) n=1 Tax=Alicyclobacillus vulcanalis TaxID=252246 RepID=A0A1N7NM70_9BACL|nr:Uncharacterised protein family (UPF0236) [Alicyclobacillus vulcanalis]
MLDIRRVLAVFLQMLSSLQNVVDEAGDFTALEQGVCGTVRGTANELLQLLLEGMDRKLQEERDKTRWALIHRKARTLVTTVGEITIWRRYYRDKQTGERRFL